MKAILEEFGPVSHRRHWEPIIRRRLVFRHTPWVIGNFLQGWQMDVYQAHPFGTDPNAFLEGMQPHIHKKLTEEILGLRGVKFWLSFQIQL